MPIFLGNSRYGMVPKWSYILHQLLVSDDPVLFESTHDLLDTYIDPLFVFYQCSEVVRINDFLRDDFQWNAHKFRVLYGIVQVKMFDIGQ